MGFVLTISEEAGLLVLRLAFVWLGAVQRQRRGWSRWRTRLRLSVAQALRRLGLAREPLCRRAPNRVGAQLEEALCRLHVDVPHLGARSLCALLLRIMGETVAPTTARRILVRRRELVVELEAGRAVPRRIEVSLKLKRWALDWTVVWLLGVVPVWVLGVVDFRGSRILSLEVCPPTAAAAVKVLARLFRAYGRPELLQSDNGPQLLAEDFGAFLRREGVKHVRIRPGRPWTNGRIERVFRTFKEVLRWYAPVLLSGGHLARVCADFVVFHNECRPHASWGGRTPNEVFFRKEVRGPIGQLLLFDGQVRAHRFR